MKWAWTVLVLLDDHKAYEKIPHQWTSSLSEPYQKFSFFFFFFFFLFVNNGIWALYSIIELLSVHGGSFDDARFPG